MENAPDVLHHMAFKGLPSPAAAATVAALVLLFAYLQTVESGWKAAPWLTISAGATLPALTFAAAVLMISRFRYPHLLNRFVAGRKPFGYIVVAVALLVVALMFLQLALAVGALLYTLSGPVAGLWRRFQLSRKARAVA